MNKKLSIAVVLFALLWPLVSAGQCSELFISMYVCGSGVNKAVEIYNPTSAPVVLTGVYRLSMYENGAATPTNFCYLKGSIAPYGTFVVSIGQTTVDSVYPPSGPAYASPPCDTALQRVANQLDSAHAPAFSYFNGDDALSLDKKTGGVWGPVDIFGVIGEYPTSSTGSHAGWWNIAPYFNATAGHAWTKYHSLVRKSNVVQGTGTNPQPGTWNVSVEYDSLPNSGTGRPHYYPTGSHTCSCGTAAPGMSFTVSATQASCSSQCSGSATVTVSQGTPPFTYSWNTTPVQTSASAAGLCPGNYTVTVSDSKGNQGIKQVTIPAVIHGYAPYICAVTVDSLSGHNVILWDKTSFAGSSVDSFIIYREITTNNYQPIGRVPFHALSRFSDTVKIKYFPNTGDPNSGTYRYKIAVHDTCGNYSVMSPYHNTIFMVNNNGNFSWSQPYTIEGSPSPVNSYILMRDDYNSGTWHAINSVTGSQQNVTDPAYSSWVATANWRIETQWSITCTPTAKTEAAYTGSISNSFIKPKPSGIRETTEAPVINVFPNPVTNGSVSLESADLIRQADVYNVMGELVKSREFIPAKTISLDVQDMPRGMYLLKCISKDNRFAVTKFIIQ